jgi:hypothetical protein
MLKNISLDDFYVLLVEGFALGISAGIIFETGFPPNNYFSTPYFECLIIILIVLGGLVCFLDSLFHIKDNPMTKSIIYIVGVIFGCFILIPVFSIITTGS